MRLFEWFSPTVHVVADGHFHGLALRGKKLFSHISLVVKAGIIIITVILFTRILLGKIFRQLPSSKVIIIARRVWMIPLTTPTLLQRRRLAALLLAFAWLGLILFPCYPSLDTISRSTSAYFYGDASRAAVFRAQPSVPATLNKRSLCYAGETTTFLWLTFCVKLQWIHVFRSSKCRMLKRIPSLEVEHQHIPKMDRVVTDHWCWVRFML